MVEYAALLDQIDGGRTLEQTAILEASLVHARCLIGFLSGDYKGRWHQDDMRPDDFLAQPWRLPDAEDRELRGYVPIINENLAHLSWRRLDPEPVLLPITLLAHLVDWNMRLFVAECEAQQASLLAWFQATAGRTAAALPARRPWAATAVEPAPRR